MSSLNRTLYPSLAIGALTVLLAGGCNSPQSAPRTTGSGAPAPASVGTPMQDVRTEATIQEMENWYNAEKNSQPTRQHEAEAKKRRKAEEQQRKQQQLQQQQQQQQQQQGAPPPQTPPPESGQ